MNGECSRLDHEPAVDRIIISERLLVQTHAHCLCLTWVEMDLVKALEFLGRADQAALIVTDIYLSDLCSRIFSRICNLEIDDKVTSVFNYLKIRVFESRVA